MPFSDYGEKVALDLMFRGDTTGLPTSWYAALSTASPTASSFTEVGTGSGYARQTVQFAAAASPAGSNSNSNVATFGPFSSACTISGAAVFNTSGTAGSMISWNTLTAARTLSAGDMLQLPVGQILNTMS